MNDTLKSLRKLRIAGMLSESALQEVENRLLQKPNQEVLQSVGEI
ncbi:hypothetical protein [Aequorivita lipolytica]|nr:hypothetical protein [Aequorivita lipolytica]SRX53468.1 hypothetical protein AEQU2_02699 [Aequorivita lipolytica]